MVIVRKQASLGQRLLQEGFITNDQLELALKEQLNTNEKLGEILVKLNFLDPKQLLPILAKHIGVEHVDIDIDNIKEDLLSLIPEDVMRKDAVIPVSKMGNKLSLAMANPTNVFLIDELQLRTKFVIKPVLALKENILEILEQYEKRKSEQSTEAVETALKDLDVMGDEDIEIAENAFEDIESGLGTDSAPVVRGVNAIIGKAIKIGASDIHIEPYEKEIRVRCRVDGVLVELKKLPRSVLNAFISRIKIISDLDIAEKRLPQDGRFKIKLGRRFVDFRVSTMPTIYGEKVVMRILDKGNVNLDLKYLGFTDSDMEILEKVFMSPYGMILVTGPTGSGKSTTLYAALDKLNKSDVNISTAEDPVEYDMYGVNQVHCRSEIGLDFATALRTFLRQDPDIIMVGEIRDQETAEISIKAALTGHLVLSTLHTNDAPSAVQRLINMGIEPFMISASLLMVQAQRLVRRICPYCKEKHHYSKDVYLALGLDYEKYGEVDFYKGAGCEHCNESGYKGRTVIYEIMRVDDELRDLIAKGANTHTIKNKARELEMKTLRENGIQKAIDGITSLDEILRVTME